MNMLNNRYGEEYADALKEALVMKRNGTITEAIDTELGHLLYSVSLWAIAEAIKAKKLLAEVGNDEDFKSDVLCSIVAYSNRVDLNRKPKEIIIYLKKIGRSAIRDKIMYMGAQKRQREDVPLDGVVMTSDFYGEVNGVSYDLEYDDNADNKWGTQCQ